MTTVAGRKAYRCRACRAVFLGPDPAEWAAEDLARCLDGRPIAVRAHRCSPRLTGVADFAGVQTEAIGGRS